MKPLRMAMTLIASFLLYACSPILNPSSTSSATNTPTKIVEASTPSIETPEPLKTEIQQDDVARPSELPFELDVADDSLDDDEIIDLILFNQSENDCELPCWNQFRPGVSPTNDLASFYARLDLEPELLHAYEQNHRKFIWANAENQSDWWQQQPFMFIPSALWDYEADEVLALYLEYYGVPQQFHLSELLNQLGNEADIQMNHRGIADGYSSEIQIIFPESNSSITFSLPPIGDELLCPETGVMDWMIVVLASPDVDIAHFATPVDDPPKPPEHFTGLTSSEVLSLLKQSRCLPLVRLY
jgi:hypothetical protein